MRTHALFGICIVVLFTAAGSRAGTPGLGNAIDIWVGGPNDNEFARHFGVDFAFNHWFSENVATGIVAGWDQYRHVEQEGGLDVSNWSAMFLIGGDVHLRFPMEEDHPLEASYLTLGWRYGIPFMDVEYSLPPEEGGGAVSLELPNTLLVRAGIKLPVYEMSGGKRLTVGVGAGFDVTRGTIRGGPEGDREGDFSHVSLRIGFVGY